MSEFRIAILAADRVFYEGPCESLVGPTVLGQHGILANHSNMISALVPLIFPSVFGNSSTPRRHSRNRHTNIADTIISTPSYHFPNLFFSFATTSNSRSSHTIK